MKQRINQISILWTGFFLLLNGSAISAQTPIITNSPIIDAGVGGSFSLQTTALDSPTSYSASGLPSGLSINSTTGLISGSPSAQGVYYATLDATNSAGTCQTPISFLMGQTSPPITSSLSVSATVGVPFTYQVAVAQASNYQAAGLPPGLSLGLFTGTISGTPTTQGLYLVKLIVQQASSAASTALLVITVNAGTGSLPVVTSAASASGQVGATFSYQIAASNGAASYYAAGLPSGLYLNAATGQISGTPALAGAFNVLLEALNGVGAGSQSLSLTISPAAEQIPVITSAPTAQGIANSTSYGFTPYQVIATGGPTSFGATGLPPGLNFDSSLAQIYGTPTTAGTYPVTLTASNSMGTGTATLTITIAPTGTLPPVVTSPRPEELRVGTATGAPGSIVSLPIYLVPSPDLESVGPGFELSLPPHVTLLASNFASAGPPAVDAGFQVTGNPALNEVESFSFGSSEGPGVILTLQLYIDSGIPGGVLPISLANAVDDGDSVTGSGAGATVPIPVTVVDGAVTVTGGPPPPSLVLTKTSSVSQAKSSNPITFMIAYQNTSSVAANSAQITDVIPAGTTLVNGSITNGGTLSSGTITWNLGTVAAGASGSVGFQVTVN